MQARRHVEEMRRVSKVHQLQQECLLAAAVEIRIAFVVASLEVVDNLWCVPTISLKQPMVTHVHALTLRSSRLQHPLSLTLIEVDNVVVHAAVWSIVRFVVSWN